MIPPQAEYAVAICVIFFAVLALTALAALGGWLWRRYGTGLARMVRRARLAGSNRRV